jgi:DNA-binding NarL/FixJ family response regulator
MNTAIACPNFVVASESAGLSDSEPSRLHGQNETSESTSVVPDIRPLCALLIVEDLALAASITGVLLSERDDVRHCEFSASALNAQLVQQADVVFVELDSEGSNGIDAVSHIRKLCAWRRPFTIEFADNGASPTDSDAARAPIDLILPRDFDPTALRSVLERLRLLFRSIDDFDPMI